MKIGSRIMNGKRKQSSKWKQAKKNCKTFTFQFDK